MTGRRGLGNCCPYSMQEILFSSVQALSLVRLCATPWTAPCQASLSNTNSWSLLKLISIKSVMPSNHLSLCRPLSLPAFNPFGEGICGLVVKNLPANGDAGSTPGLGRSLGEGNGNLLRYSCLGNPMDRGALGLQTMGLQRVGHNLETKQQQQICDLRLE